nr:putative nuclease HARBI1 [Tanacetum cinerariifolium]
MSVEEQVARFLHIVGNDFRTRFVSWLYRRSVSATSRHFHRVLNAIISLEDQYIKQLIGTASDSRIVKDALTRDDKLIIPDGKYYLVDGGLPHRSTLIAPYRGVRYHLKECSARAPQNPRELFNLRHSSLRNSIERAFDVLKKRFPILRSTTEPFYSCDTQSNIFLACCILHNFLLEVDRDKELEDEVIDEMLAASHDGEPHGPRDTDDRGEQIRNSIANDMWMGLEVGFDVYCLMADGCRLLLMLFVEKCNIDGSGTVAAELGLDRLSVGFRSVAPDTWFRSVPTIGSRSVPAIGSRSVNTADLDRLKQCEVIGKKANDGATINANDGATTKKESFSWNEQMDAAFIEVMLKQQNVGNRPIETFSPHAYNNMQAETVEEIKHFENNVINLDNIGTSDDIHVTSPTSQSHGKLPTKSKSKKRKVLEEDPSQDKIANSLDNIVHALDRNSKNDNSIISEDSSVEQSGETVEQHPANFEEKRALYDSLYQNLAIKVEKVNLVNRKFKETNADLTTELARFKNQEKCFEISQEKYDKLERCYQQSVYHEQCLSKKINALHLSTGKQIMTLNEQISDLNKHLSKKKSTVFFLIEEKKKLKSDFKTREDELLDKQI